MNYKTDIIYAMRGAKADGGYISNPVGSVKCMTDLSSGTLSEDGESIEGERVSREVEILFGFNPLTKRACRQTVELSRFVITIG